MEREASKRTKRFGSAERDLVALGIAVAAIIMFVGTGGSVLPQIARSWAGNGAGPDTLLANALILNIALILFGWRRYTQLTMEIGERRKAEEQARRLAETDPLTSTLNRRSIGPATNILIEQAKAEARAVLFAMIDLDNFKLVNDLNGHKCGDHVLRVTADRIRSTLPEGSLLSRLGGDEFACAIIYDPAFPEEGEHLALQLIDQVSRPIRIDDTTVEITMSVGLASTVLADKMDAATEARTLDGEALMHKADIAMYHAKKRGRNGYFWFEPRLEIELHYRNQLEAGIRRGITLDEFVPYYEQQVDIVTGHLLGFEMLARWHSPNLGVVSPEVFIPIAEEIGLIGELSESLIAKALEDAKGWAPHLTVAVNISPIQMRDPWFSQKLLKLLVHHGFPANRFEIEITESCLHENVGMVRSMITSLRNQGIKVSLDDFGTGYSSLAQLRTLPFDRLKIDRSFVSELKDAGASSKIVSAIISLGDGLDMPITAEGIENEQVLEVLQQFGQLKGQGYHYGRPEDAAAVRPRLDRLGLLAGQDTSENQATGADLAPPAARRA